MEGKAGPWEHYPDPALPCDCSEPHLRTDFMPIIPREM